MTDAGKTLTTGEYSKLSGISVSTITKQLRKGTLSGRKINGKWAIDASEVQNLDASPKNGGTNRKARVSEDKKAPPSKPSGDKAYDVTTFSRMTYLTEKGVRQWLKTGRLSGSVDEAGNQLVDADNLDRPEMHHLVRK